MPARTTRFSLIIPLLSAALLTACDRRSSTPATGPAQPAAPGKTTAAPAPTLLPKRPISFNQDIRPIFADVCFNCHGADLHKAEGGLSVIDLEHATKAGKDGKLALVPGHPEKSEIVARIWSKKEPMPPVDSHKVLTQKQKELITQWVKEGGKYQKHWAYEYPKMTPTPEVKEKNWPLSFTDNYLLADLETKGIPHAPEADRATLCRRLYQDLLGLPPTPAQMDAFLADKRPDAYEQLVDSLLANPHHGERMATYWLDLVRYADTVGLHGDQGQNASPYRDWVIDAFINNMPQDKFIDWQLGGDLVEGLDAKDRNDAMIASCFNRLNMTSHEGGIQLKEYEAIYLADRVRNTSQALMGASMGCCQCHDHKYDPYSIKDFYALGSLWSDIDDEDHLRRAGTLNAIVTTRLPEMTLLSPLDRMRQAQLGAQLAAEKDPAKIKGLEAQIKAIKPRKVMVSQASAKPREVRVLPRGNWMSKDGEIVTPQVPKFLGSFEKMGVKGRANRLDFAHWLTWPEAKGGCGELTARVWVNRLWYLFYGEGLCPSIADFGGQGEPCAHIELLDRLTLEYMKGGWDNRKFIRMLVTSRAYRMASTAPAQLLADDPRNLEFARQGRWRLPAENIRDTALAASGLLVSDIDGQTIRPYQPEGYYQHLQFPDRTYHADTDSNEWRRGVYVHWQRMFLHPALKAFDAPSREDSCPRRAITNTPLAALVALNDPTFVEAARALAQMTLQAGLKDDDARCRFILRRCLSHAADDQEVAVLKQVLETARADFALRPDDAAKLLAIGLAPLDKTLNTTELAACTQAARVALNLHETLTRD